MSHARKSLFIVLVIVSLLSSACSSFNETPTPSLQELQMTAQAAAAATLTAQAPTATPVTPSPSPTPIPVIVAVEPVMEVIPTQPPVVVQPQPIQPVVVPPAATEEKKEQDCGNSYINAGTEGPRAPVSIINKKGAFITLSYYLEPSPFGQCGSGSTTLSGDSKTLNLPLGCYYLYAWVNHEGKDQSFQGYSCLSKKSNITWLIFPDRLEEVKN